MFYEEMIRTSGEASAGEMGNEECKTDTNRCDESGTVFLSGEHEDGEDQERGQEHLDEQTAHDRRVDVQARLDMQPLHGSSGLACLLIVASHRAGELT
jgi:hypothetical protein